MNRKSNPDPLLGLLASIFGFSVFRPGQEAVCRAAVEGRDLLLVMPTGAGKSLCYQLPALARGGTALVISPLIALMDDQAAKLSALGLKVARIHSGLDRAVAREACVQYLRGDLQFLFIAPERLRVPGFPEMLAKKKLALIAIDEAHCISQWGHDFRPDYRMLGQYIPGLRGEGSPTPVLALTATATPAVQADILEQLAMVNPAQFIHGFRRSNLSIEVVELPVPERAQTICSLLQKKSSRPAIVYATSRKQAEKLAEELALRLPAAAYHAGMEPDARERSQTAFLAGELDVIVATIAFGMGIDKADIRTVIHAGLPATLEGYYQEIGRAGRDGKQSRTYLMHSYADQRTHDFFLTRDYPPIDHLNEVFARLDEDPQQYEDLQEQSKLDAEAFDKALEKLQIHGGALVDFGGTVVRGGPAWRKSYTVQAQHRTDQFQKVVRFTESHECRMASLVGHFGDKSDANRPCGHCDCCDPSGAVLRQFRRASEAERELVQEIVDDLRTVEYKAAGTLQRAIGPLSRLSRDDYEALLNAMVRADLLAIENAEYEKDGETRSYRRLKLTTDGQNLDEDTNVELLFEDGIVDEFAGSVKKSTMRKRSSTRGSSSSAAGDFNFSSAKGVGAKGKGSSRSEEEPVKLSTAGEVLATKIRSWRAAEAKKLRIPPFMILHDRTLASIAAKRPKSLNQLLSVSGMGQAKVDRFGADLVQLCTQS